MSFYIFYFFLLLLLLLHLSLNVESCARRHAHLPHPTPRRAGMIAAAREGRPPSSRGHQRRLLFSLTVAANRLLNGHATRSLHVLLLLERRRRRRTAFFFPTPEIVNGRRRVFPTQRTRARAHVSQQLLFKRARPFRPKKITKTFAPARDNFE